MALAASAVTALPQAVTQDIAPSAPAPQGCMPDYQGEFQITVRNVTTSPAKVKRQAAQPLEITLAGGVLKDSQQRTGYIASNYQFQFDGPPQAGAIYTSGFSVCDNGSLALGGSAVFYQCYSGGFYNLYDRHWAAQCSPIYIEVIGHSGSGSASSGAATQLPDGQPGVASQIPDGQVQATPMPVGQIGDGQIQQPNAPVGQIGDGQVQASPVGQIGDGQVQATPAPPAPAPVGQIGDGQVQQGGNVGQISDGQVQASPVGQIGDGQVQATPAAPAPAPVGQIGDGQIQASSAAAPVGQIGDGQVQATSAAAPVGQIGDGQVQATSAAAPVGQIGDGQIQASSPVVQQVSATSAYAPVQQTVNAAPGLSAELPAAIAGVLAAIALL